MKDFVIFRSLATGSDGRPQAAFHDPYALAALVMVKALGNGDGFNRDHLLLFMRQQGLRNNEAIVSAVDAILKALNTDAKREELTLQTFKAKFNRDPVDKELARYNSIVREGNALIDKGCLALINPEMSLKDIHKQCGSYVKFDAEKIMDKNLWKQEGKLLQLYLFLALKSASSRTAVKSVEKSVKGAAIWVDRFEVVISFRSLARLISKSMDKGEYIKADTLQRRLRKLIELGFVERRKAPVGKQYVYQVKGLI